MKNQEIISRRNFFKRSASAILPALAAITLPNVLTSCEIEDDEWEIEATGCMKTCTGKCSGVCGAACQSNCTGSCSTGCTGSCSKMCGGSSCRSLCKGAVRYDA